MAKAKKKLGRPKGTRQTEPLRCRIEASLKEQLMVKAAAEERSVNKIVEKAIEAYIVK